MNKKIFSLLFLLILLVSVTLSYAYFNQPTTDSYNLDTNDDVDDDALSAEIDSTFLNEDQDIEIGEMI